MMHHVSEEGLNENTMLWELRFIGLMASKVGAAGRQQRIAYEVNNNTYNIRVYRCSMDGWIFMVDFVQILTEGDRQECI